MDEEIKCSPSKSSSSSEVEMVDLGQSSTDRKLPREVKCKKKSNIEINQEASAGKNSVLDGWTAKTFGMMRFTFITNLFAALWGVNGGIDLSSSTCKVFFFLMMVNFYASVVGILLWHVFPLVARGFHLIAFLCAMLSLTILFCEIVPDELKRIPWIFMTIVLLMVIGLLIYELSSLSYRSSYTR